MKTTLNIHLNSDSASERHNAREQQLIAGENIKNSNHLIDIDNTFGDSFHDVLYHSDLVDKYSEVFGDAIDEYNKRQTRNDRKLTVKCYMRSVENDTRGKAPTKLVNGKRIVDESKHKGKRLIYELIICVGNTECAKDADGKIQYDDTNHQIRPEYLPRELQREIILRYLSDFDKRNPNFAVVSKDIHGDEMYLNRRGVWEYGNVHGHLGFIPFATGFKTGLSVQNSMNKALAAMGCTYIKNEQQPYDVLCNRERLYFEGVACETYKQYCQAHPEYSHADEELFFYHPVAERMRKGDLTKEQYDERRNFEEEKAEFKSEQAKLEASNISLQNKMIMIQKMYEDYLIKTDDVDKEKKLYNDKNKALNKAIKEIENSREQCKKLTAEARKFIKFNEAEKKIYEDKNTALNDAIKAFNDEKRKWENEFNARVNTEVENRVSKLAKQAQRDENIAHTNHLNNRFNKTIHELNVDDNTIGKSNTKGVERSL